MKVLDPQSALLTTSEVHRFLAGKPPRPAPKKIGSYTTVNLKGYEGVRNDFLQYVIKNVSYTQTIPESFIKAVVPKLRSFGLTKTEALVLINLGVGLPRTPGSTSTANAEAEEVDEEAAAEESQEPDDRQLLLLVIEELEERFSDEKSDALLKLMRTEFDRAQAKESATTNGATAMNKPV